MATPLDVMAALRAGELCYHDEQLARRLLSFAIDLVKDPEHAGKPLSPLELRRITRILDGLSDALLVAQEVFPNHFQLVAVGEPNPQQGT